MKWLTDMTLCYLRKKTMVRSIDISASAIHHSRNYGEFEIIVAVDPVSNDEHIVLVKGNVGGGSNVLCRVSSECVTGTVLNSTDCDCNDQLEYSLNEINQKGKGVFILLKQEGRGHGLKTKIKALNNKNKGMNTFDAVKALGLAEDVREYRVVRNILDALQVESICLLTNSPVKVKKIEDCGVTIERVLNIPVHPN